MAVQMDTVVSIFFQHKLEDLVGWFLIFMVANGCGKGGRTLVLVCAGAVGLGIRGVVGFYCPSFYCFG